jgi:two-component system, cell cycle sensor histidine kinase and response regulator CckA
MTPSIIIVEDEFIVAAEIEERLTAMGYRMAGAADSGELALELINRQRPDLVLMDIRLRGEMDGITAATEIRRRFHLPVIFLTAYSEDSTLDRAKLAEPYGYILKPFDDRELKSTIEIALYRHGAEAEIHRLNRLYDVLSQVNQAVVRIPSREELLWTVCRLIVERGAVDVAWIEWLETDTARLKTVACFGERSDLVKHLHGDQDKPPHPSDTVFVSNDCNHQKCLRSADCAGARLGFRSCGSFPIYCQESVCGVLRLGSAEPDFFQEREVALLKEVAMDISFALDKLEADARKGIAEMELRKSESKFRSYIEHAPLGVVVADRSGRFLEFNPTATTMFGYGDAELPGLSIPDILASESLETGLEHFRAVVESGLAHGQYRFNRKDGSELWASISAAKIDESRFLAFCQDITVQRREIEMRLESQEKLRLFIEYAPACLAMFDREMRYLSASRRWLEDFHLGDRDLRGLLHYDVFPELPEYWRQIHRRGLSGEVIRAEEDQFEQADGSIQWLRWEVRPWRAPNGDVGGILIFSEDITERKQIQESVAERERYLRTILQTTVDGFWVVDLTGRFIEVNEAYCRMTGYNRTEFLAMHVSDAEAIDQPADIATRIERIIANGSESFESRHRKKDGSVFDVQMSVTYLEVGTGQMVCFCRDITERKRGEETLRESEEQLKAMFEMASIGIAQAEPKTGKWVRVNHKMTDITGYSYAELLSMRIPEITHPEDRDRDWEAFQNVVSNRAKDYRLENRYIRKDGTIIWVNVNMTVIRDATGQSIRTVAMVEDITERKRMDEKKAQLEAQLRQAQKMEAIGHLAGGIAHDFNNILSAILGYTEMALDCAPTNSALHEDLKEVISAGLRAKELVNQILTFSRQTIRDPKPVQIAYIVKEVVKMLRAMLPSTISIHQKNILPPQSRILADPTEIHQVIMNLCTNAAHAMRLKGGDLDIVLQEVEFGDDEPGPHPDIVQGRYIRLSVSDTGHGMSEEVADQIFNPYFTTKAQGEGNGMGLSVVHGIVKNCNGAITVESKVGDGSTFYVYFPAIKMDNTETAQDLPLLMAGKGRILFVDDERPLIDLGQKMLERIGYNVTTVSSAREALEMIASNPYWFDLLITDYTMPRMTGLDLSREAKRIRPDIPVIVCSGYNDTLNEKTFASFGIEAFVPKPFDWSELSRVIDRAIHGK